MLLCVVHLSRLRAKNVPSEDAYVIGIVKYIFKKCFSAPKRGGLPKIFVWGGGGGGGGGGARGPPPPPLAPPPIASTRKNTVN